MKKSSIKKIEWFFSVAKQPSKSLLELNRKVIAEKQDSFRCAWKVWGLFRPTLQVSLTKLTKEG